MAIQQVDMKEKLYKALGWLHISNRPAHIICVGVMSLALGWCAGIASIIALEYKDVQYGDKSCWDWLDCLAGAIGCAIGGAIHYYIFRHL